MVRIINIDTKTRTVRVSNGKDDLEWFTTDTGSHVPLKKGQSKAEAIKEHFGDGRSSGKKRLDELNKKYGTNKGYLIQSDRPLNKKKDGVIKEYEDFGKATPEVSLTETGAGFHERTKQPVGQDTKKSEKKTKPAKLNSITLDRKLVRGGLSDYEIDILEKMQDYYDISDETINAAIDSGEYSAREIFKRLRNYDDEFAEHLGDLSEQPAKQEPKQSSQPTSYQLEEAFEEADLGEEWKSAQRRMDFHGVSQYTIKDIIDSGMYEAGDIIEALESNRHDKIDEMKKMADKTVGEKRREAQWEKQFGPLDEKKYQEQKAKQQPVKKETPDTSNADYFKSTMQETMKKFPRLYEHEQKHLEEYAVSAFSALRNNPGKEKAIVDEILDSYNQHVKRLGMWVDTPTLAKKAFVEKLAEAYK